jgi:hypothetical protein
VISTTISVGRPKQMNLFERTPLLGSNSTHAISKMRLHGLFPECIPSGVGKGGLGMTQEILLGQRKKNKKNLPRV